MRWSELWDKPERLAIELSPLEITADVLILDIRDVSELRERTELLEAKGNFGALLLLALQWFGDKGHLQPLERRDWPGYGRTKAWAQLPPLEDDEPAGAQRPRRPRHRHPDPIPKETVKRLKWQLAQRKAELARKAKRGERQYTQGQIAAEVGIDRTRVQQAEALQLVGWELLRSNPDFSANDDFVRWPNVKEAARILMSTAQSRSNAPVRNGNVLSPVLS